MASLPRIAAAGHGVAATCFFPIGHDRVREKGGGEPLALSLCINLGFGLQVRPGVIIHIKFCSIFILPSDPHPLPAKAKAMGLGGGP